MIHPWTIFKYLTILGSLVAATAVVVGNSVGSANPCPADMVCLAGLVVPNIGPLPVVTPVPGSNLGYGDGPISHTPGIIKGEIAAVLPDEESNSSTDEHLTIYVIEDVYGKSHRVKTRQFDETDENGELLFHAGSRVLADKRGATSDHPDVGTLSPWPLGEKEELGRKMFCDNRLAKNNVYGCATCHLPHHGFADFHETSLGFDGKHGTRNTPSLYNAAFIRPLFWDGRARTLEDQAFHPLLNPIEMSTTASELRKKLAINRELDFIRLPRKHLNNNGAKPPVLNKTILNTITVQTLDPVLIQDQNFPPSTKGVLITNIESTEERSLAESAGLRRGDVIQNINGRLIEGEADYKTALENLQDNDEVQLRLLRHGKYYAEHFREVFGADVNFQAIAEALSAYERTILLTNTVFDRYMSGFAPSEFGDAEKRGLDLFRGKARCILCHNGPNFSDGKFHNIGYPINGQGQYAVQDLGRHLITRKEGDKGAFKTPSLRGLTDTWPYMHDGLIPANFKALPNNTARLEKGLEEVVELFNMGGGKGNIYVDPLMKPLGLSPKDKRDLIAFLKTLASPRKSALPDCPFNVDLDEDPNESLQKQSAR